MRLVFASVFISLMIASLIIPLYTVNASVNFSDDFEKGSLSAWTGSRASFGDSIQASSYRSYTGAFAGRATTSGGGGTEYAYTYKDITTPEVCAEGVFCMIQSGIVDNGDRIRLISLQSGSTTLASAGWEWNNGQVRWFLTANDGTQTLTSYSALSPQTGTWYMVALIWTEDSVNGKAKLYVGTAYYNFVEVCSIIGTNTAAYGDMRQLRVGLPAVTNCGATALYFDCTTATDAPEYDPEPVLGFFPTLTVFSDGFESGRYNRWSGVNIYNGGAARISTNAYQGVYSARFTTDSSTRYGQAYCYRLFPDAYNLWGNEYNFGAYFKLASASMVNGSRIYLIRAWYQGNEVYSAGLIRANGQLLQFQTIKGQYLDENQQVVTDPTFYGSPVSLNQWFYLGSAFNLYIYDIFGNTNLLFGDPLPMDRIDIGIAKSSNCNSASLYVDDFSTYIETNE